MYPRMIGLLFSGLQREKISRFEGFSPGSFVIFSSAPIDLIRISNGLLSHLKQFL